MGIHVQKILERSGCVVENRGRKLVPWMVTTSHGVEGQCLCSEMGAVDGVVLYCPIVVAFGVATTPCA